MKKELLSQISLPPQGTKLKDYSGRELTLLILYTIAAGALVCTAITVPGLAVILKFVDAQSSQDRRRIVRRMKTLEKQKYIKKNKGVYHITGRAKDYLTEEAIWALSIKVPKTWDKKWRVVLFDIPAKKQKGRTALRTRLKELGFFQYQDSVFVHAYEVQDVISKVAEHYNVRQHVNYMLVEKLERENELKHTFGLR